MKYIGFLIAMLSVCLTNCEYVANINDPGTKDSLTVAVGIIDNVVIEVPCRLVLTNNNGNILKASGCDYILEGYKYENEGQNLIISHKNAGLIQKEKMADIYISPSNVLYITANAPCIITSPDTLAINQLTIVVNGRGTYTETDMKVNCELLNLTVYGRSCQTSHLLEGNATASNFHIEGCTNIDASNLSSQIVTVTHQSVGDCKVWANQSLTATIYSTGNIYYKGNPSVALSKQKSAFLSAEGSFYHLEE
jgi:hypothetical protein